MSDAYLQREAEDRADDEVARARELQERRDRFIEKVCSCGESFDLHCAVHNPLVSSPRAGTA